jgi:hypothetical protein
MSNVSIGSMWIDNNTYHASINIQPPEVSLSVGGMTNTVNPPSQTFELNMTTVNIGKVSISLICDYAQVTYREPEYLSIDNAESRAFKELLDIHWYKGDMIYISGQAVKFQQGYIAGNISEPVTLRVDPNNQREICFQYGDVIPLNSIMTGMINNNLELIQHWWKYIRSLMDKKLFNDMTYSDINHHMLNVYEKNVFELKG